jgi:transcriptional regulator with XRE-family HTH domain
MERWLLVMSTLLGARIRQARRSANLSQSQLAAKIGAHVTSVSDWERGRNAPTARHLLSIAKATGTSIEHFTTDDAEEDDADVAFPVLFDAFLERRVRAILTQIHQST